MANIQKITEFKAGRETLGDIHYTVYYDSGRRVNYYGRDTLPMTVVNLLTDENTVSETVYIDDNYLHCVNSRTTYTPADKPQEAAPAEETTETAEQVEETETEDPEADTDTDTEEEEEEETMFSNYVEAVTKDAVQYIRDNYTAEELAEKLTDREEFWEELNDAIWVADEVTGNGSGSYTFDRAQAREYVLADIDTVREALKEFCTPADTIAEKFLDEDWEYFDVTARCYVLGQVIEDAIDRVIEKEVA